MALTIKSTKVPTIGGSVNLLGKAVGENRSDPPRGLTGAKSPIGEEKEKNESDNGEVARSDGGNSPSRFALPGTEGNFLARITQAASQGNARGFAGAAGGGGAGAGGGASGGGGSAGGGGSPRIGQGGGGGGRPPGPQGGPDGGDGPQINPQDPFKPHQPKQTDFKLDQLQGSKIYNSDNSVNQEQTTLNDQAKQAAQTQGSAVLVFSGRNCPPCKELSKEIERLQAAGKAIVKIDVDEKSELTKKFGVTSWPTSVAGYFDKEGKFVEVGRQGGAGAKLDEMLSKADKAKKDYDQGLIKPDPNKKPEQQTVEKNPNDKPVTQAQIAAFKTNPSFADDPSKGLTRTQALRYLQGKLSDGSPLTATEKAFVRDFSNRKISECANGSCGTDFTPISEKGFEERLKGFNDPALRDAANKYQYSLSLSSDHQSLVSSHYSGQEGETKHNYPLPENNFDENLASITQKALASEQQQAQQ